MILLLVFLTGEHRGGGADHYKIEAEEERSRTGGYQRCCRLGASDCPFPHGQQEFCPSVLLFAREAAGWPHPIPMRGGPRDQQCRDLVPEGRYAQVKARVDLFGRQ